MREQSRAGCVPLHYSSDIRKPEAAKVRAEDPTRVVFVAGSVGAFLPLSQGDEIPLLARLFHAEQPPCLVSSRLV